jgi:uncharacterized protein (TIGR00369 family)
MTHPSIAATRPEESAEQAMAKTVAQWQAEEQAVRQRADAGGSTAGVATPAQVAGLSGMQVFEAIFAGQLPRPPIGDTLDFIPVAVQKGHAVFQGRPLTRHYNPLGTVHGGWFSTLLDSALGCAVHSALPAGKAYTTLELKVNMIRALTVKVPLVRAIGQVIHVGGQVATAEAKLVGPDGKLYAHATTTCLVFDARPPQ